MYYTVDVKQILRLLFGLFLALAFTACGSGSTLPAPLETAQETPQVDSAQNSRPVIPNRELQKSLPDVCDCILRFDHLSIEQGMSQSSVHVIFQDSRGFLWM